ncbi:PAS domain S-box protein [Candidatus Solirubrobacter pratensis]|uniref:PAS domain S-box protein n=1 Tax=Candidatus Solirubrobacter pratensis TaxID=1298857 RepID=UPI000684EC11|nr:PAS domain S-box protein [Candidatus Solirubrobacter pratensis]
MLILGLTAAGFLSALLLGERDARRDSEHRAEVAAAQIRGRVEQGASLAESLRRFMVSVGGKGVTSGEFQSNASRWLSPAGFPASAWAEQVPASGRGAYERRIGRPVVTRSADGRVVRVGSRSSYLPATLVSGIPPMTVPGIDLGGEPGMSAARARASTLYDAGATPLLELRDGARGLFLVKLAPRLAGGVVRPGYVVVFLSELWLRAAATDTATLRLTVGGGSAGAPMRNAVHHAFTEAGQRFDVAVPRRPVHGAAVVLPWIILAAGLILAGSTAALGVNAARRARAQEELDRIFTLSPDLIVVADLRGHFRRVNPAVTQVLGYSEEDLLRRAYLDLVHPDDRERTAAEAAAIGAGKTTLSFENRFACKDGSFRLLEWTSTPAAEDGVIYGMARDVTERRRAETELGRLAGEQAALRRVATLVARGVPAAEVFSAVAGEVGRLLDAQATTIGRLEPDGTMEIVASSGTASRELPVGSRLALRPGMALCEVARTGRSARVDDYDDAPPAVERGIGRMGIRCTVAVPIVVEGSLWGSIAAGTERERFPEDAEQRMAEFTELAGTAIANAESRSALTASRARVVAASDATRRQIERDLHDGAQQRLVHTVITLKLASRALGSDDASASALVSEALDHAEQATVELRELAQGILPPVLTRGGLQAAIEGLASRTPVPVELDVSADRFPPAVEASAYFVVAEALTNVAKHSLAGRAHVRVCVGDATLRVEVRDDGAGGAHPGGSGFVGLADRLAVLDGQLFVESPAGGGTLVVAEIPLG